MKKKTIIFSCLTFIFLISIPESFSSSFSTGIICIGLFALFAVLAYRSFKASKSDTVSTDDFSDHTPIPTNEVTNPNPVITNNSSNNVSIPSNTNSVSHTSQHNTNTESTPDTSPYEFIYVKLAGVTFKNDDGTERQQILRALKFHDAPYDTEIDVSICEYQFNNEPAYGVYLNDVQIGNIPRHLIPYIHDNFHRIESISNITAYGGGRANGKAKSYGAEITIRLYKDK